MKYGFYVPGVPQGKGRPKFSNIGGHPRAYTPSKTVEYEEHIRDCYKGEKYEGYVQININAMYPIPKNTSKKKATQMLCYEIRPDKKPDIDNIAKAVLDALNGVAYDDDKQVTKLTISKVYAQNAGMKIYIGEDRW